MFDVTDNRNPSLMLKRGGGYTTDPLHALDRESADLEPIDLERYATEARAARAEQKEREMEDLRRQERAVLVQLRERLSRLSPLAQAVLLAQVERLIGEADREAA
jgi:hypothetical protein